MFDIESLHRAFSVEAAVALLEAHPEARLIAGGTDVLVDLRHLGEKYKHLVDIHDVPELKEIRLDENGNLFVGSGVTFSGAINSDLVQQYIPVLAEACATVAGPQIRNMGTVGGNIANGAVSADTAAPMLVLEPDLVIAGKNGKRVVSIQGFHTGPGKVALGQDEILTGFLFPMERIRGLGACYYKYAMRAAMDIATIGCAAGVRLEDGVMADVRLAFTVAAPTPIRCASAEAVLVGKSINDQHLQEMADALESDIKPRTSWRATKEFRTRVIKVLAKRMITEAVARAEGRVC